MNVWIYVYIDWEILYTCMAFDGYIAWSEIEQWEWVSISNTRTCRCNNTCMISYSIVCQDKMTPLHMAAEKGIVECVKELMQHADIGPALIMQDDVSYN